MRWLRFKVISIYYFLETCRLQHLFTLQHISGDQKWWEKVQLTTPTDPWCAPPSVNVEITGYALLAYIAAGRILDGLPVTKWLLAQQSSSGGYGSTQDTVIYHQILQLTQLIKCLMSYRSLASLPWQLSLLEFLVLMSCLAHLKTQRVLQLLKSIKPIRWCCNQLRYAHITKE